MKHSIKKLDTVTLSDGIREKVFIVLGFSKTHALLAKYKDYNNSVSEFGEYNTTVYGQTAWNLNSGSIHKGFWSLLKTVNGNSV
jgi:hypothetical protein